MYALLWRNSGNLYSAASLGTSCLYNVRPTATLCYAGKSLENRERQSEYAKYGQIRHNGIFSENIFDQGSLSQGSNV